MLSFHISSSANAQEELLFTDLNDMKINLVLEKDITYVFQAWASWCANCSKACAEQAMAVAAHWQLLLISGTWLRIKIQIAPKSMQLI